MKKTNNIFIGLYAGINITDESNIIIIGDGIRDLNKNQKDVLFIGDKIAIGKKIQGVDCNLYDILKGNIIKNGTCGTFIGHEAGKGQVSGNGSFIGYEAGSHGSNQDQNIMIGVNYGNNITTGNKGIKFGKLNK